LVAEAYKETANAFVEFSTLVFWEADRFPLHVPQETDESCNGRESYRYSPSVKRPFGVGNRKGLRSSLYLGTALLLAHAAPKGCVWSI